jgi:5-methylcytosine-specific restriction protein A
MPVLPKSKQRPWIPKRPQHQREFDNASFYNSKRWRGLRLKHIKKNPLCTICSTKNITTAAQCVDHIIPITAGGSPTDLKNLQSLCNPCHNTKSGREGIEYRKKIKLRGGGKL